MSVCLSILQATTPEQEKAFTENYKTDFEAGDAATLESFLYTKEADPSMLTPRGMNCFVCFQIRGNKLRTPAGQGPSAGMEPDGMKRKLLLTNRTQQSVEGHFMDRLRGGSVELETDIEPLGVGIDAELD